MRDSSREKRWARASFPKAKSSSVIVGGNWRTKSRTGRPGGGVSTRRMERLVESLGVTSLSKSQVSVMAAELDEQVEAFRTRPLDDGPYTFVAADALVLKVRENGRVVGVHSLIATGVNAEGYREILGVQVTSAEDGAGWLTFFIRP